jgi:Leu/Phe-tRNA-protein transferase
MVTQPVQFAIGQTLAFVGESGRGKKKEVSKWTIVKYHKVMNKWEVMIRSQASNVHRSIPIADLEEHYSAT